MKGFGPRVSPAELAVSVKTTLGREKALSLRCPLWSHMLLPVILHCYDK